MALPGGGWSSRAANGPQCHIEEVVAARCRHLDHAVDALPALDCHKTSARIEIPAALAAWQSAVVPIARRSAPRLTAVDPTTDRCRGHCRPGCDQPPGVHRTACRALARAGLGLWRSSP